MTDTPITITKFRKTSAASIKNLSVNPIFNDANVIVREYRQKAWERFNSLPMPSEDEEDWRRTSLQGIRFEEFSLINPRQKSETKFPVQLSEPVADKKHGGQVLVTPWDATNKVDLEIKEKGVVFQDLKSAVQEYPEIVQKVLARIDLSQSKKFSALASAMDLNGVLLYVPRNVVVESPLQSVYWVPGSGAVNAQQVLIYIEDGASVTFVHESSSPAGNADASMHTGIMEIFVGKGAHLNFVELQSWGENIINFTHENITVEADGKVDWVFGALGSKLTKNYSNLNLIGRGSAGKMSGFYFTDNKQHLDHDTQQNHLAPDTTSDLLFKGALLGQSRSVWQGMIYVAPNAVRADGYQANRNMVLSKEARADSIPGLEILTDDVKCTHGATVGKIDQNQVFYLESRGMPVETAERLIVEGFFDPIMQRIPFEGVKSRFQSAIKEKMEHIA